MAFFRKAGSILRQTASKHINHEISASSPSIFQMIRCMSSSKVFVGGLAWATDDHGLLETFNKYGEVQEARVIIDRETGRSRGFGFVTYTDPEAASAAIQALDGKEIDGRAVRVNYANDRQGGGGGFSRGGGGYGGGGGGYGGGGGGGYGGGGYQGGGGNYQGGGNYGGGGGNYQGGGSFGGGSYGDNSYGNSATGVGGINRGDSFPPSGNFGGESQSFGVAGGVGGSDNLFGSSASSNSFGTDSGAFSSGNQFGSNESGSAPVADGGQFEDNYGDNNVEPTDDFVDRRA